VVRRDENYPSRQSPTKQYLLLLAHLRLYNQLSAERDKVAILCLSLGYFGVLMSFAMVQVDSRCPSGIRLMEEADPRNERCPSHGVVPHCAATSASAAS
jgi:hypothetical protein